MATLRILQWNISIKQPLWLVAAELAKINPDIACLQEVGSNWFYNLGVDVAQELAKILGFELHYAFAEQWARFGRIEREGNAILSRLPIRSRGVVQTRQRSADDRRQEARCYVEVEVQTASGPLSVGTTHMSYNDNEECKMAELQALSVELRKHSGRLVFCADLNSEPDSPIVQELRNILVDAGPSRGKTFRDENSRFKRIDYVMVTPDVRVHSSKILRSGHSDHRPILCEIEI